MSVYFDASFVFSLFIQDAFTERADAFLNALEPEPLLSDLAGAEIVSAVSLRVRTGKINLALARDILCQFDIWRIRSANPCAVTGADIADAETFVRRLDLPLRAPDAIHLAIARRTGSAMATFDRVLASSAVTLGVDVAPV